MPSSLFTCTLAGVLAAALAHDGSPVNPLLGEGGFPDCVQSLPPHVVATQSLEENIKTITCAQKPKDHADQIAIGCIGDSITAGVHSEGAGMTYPGQLQTMLDKSSPGKYKVTNLGACGSTMMKGADSPYWKRPQYKALTSAKWDIIVIMLGTNDAKDAGSHGPHNWPHNCTGGGAHTCPFAVDYKSMVDLVRTLGTTAAGPKIYNAVPPPLMLNAVYGMNETVINTVFPSLITTINADNKLDAKAIDVFGALGGVADWQTAFPKGGCTLNNTGTAAKCGYFCSSAQKWTCDQCHPDNVGYNAMAATMKAGMGL